MENSDLELDITHCFWPDSSERLMTSVERKHNLQDVCLCVLGTCVCGECNCHDVDPSGDWGDIHGDTCECDERNCHATYDRYTDDFCSGQQALYG